MNSQMGLLGIKLGMTQIYQDDGEAIPVTIVQTGPNSVVQVKTEATRDGYNAVQLGFLAKKEHRVNKPMTGHFAKVEVAPTKHLHEFRLSAEDVAKYQAGQVVVLGDLFEVDQKVDVTGVSKGVGMAGVMKRYNFQGFIRSHGSHEFFRHGGSIGTRLTPGHVLKGKKMPGHMGAEQVTVQNLKIARIDTERNLVYLRGGVPGANGSLVLVRKAVKGKK
ncbi:MAG: 50S ribosomal protein L3 [Deltaproteobacteria bacterium]|nr:50S ribosomal protein L3 [Deltaproteobacteria bacterium]